jgi:hypothetical protein
VKGFERIDAGNKARKMREFSALRFISFSSDLSQNQKRRKAFQKRKAERQL